MTMITAPSLGLPPVGDILARVGDKWTILLLMALGGRRMRFGELNRPINGISSAC